MVGWTSSGDTKNFDKFARRMLKQDPYSNFNHFGQMGVDALSSATPVDSGETAESWGFKVTHKSDEHSIHWYNNNVKDGRQIAVLIQYGHGTGTGGYIQGIDYINPAIRPIFDKILNDIWEEVKR